MIIKCPNCQFSGRIPDHALASPHNATCPRCRYRFELHALGGDAENRMFAATDAENGPGSSSYELKAITEDIGHTDEDADERWDNDVGAVSLNGVTNGRLSLTHDSAATSTTSSGATAASIPISSAPSTEPWYSRVLQAWGIMFLVWAALIVRRSVFSCSLREAVRKAALK